MSSLAIIGAVGAVVGIGATAYSLATKPKGPLTANQISEQSSYQTVAEYTRLKNTRLYLERNIHKLAPQPGESRTASENRKLAGWKRDLAKTQESLAAYKSFLYPDAKPAGQFTSNAVTGGNAPEAAMKAGSPPASPQLIIGLAILAVVGGGVALYRQGNKKRK